MEAPRFSLTTLSFFVMILVAAAVFGGKPPSAGQASITLTNCNSELCNANDTAWSLSKTPSTQSITLPGDSPTISWTVTATRGNTSNTVLSVFGVVTVTNTGTANATLGNIVINLLNSKATCAVNSFVSLASQKFYNKTSCHRLVTSGIFVLQCGDPTGTGSGGPGYQFSDENLAGAKYPAGTLAMANSGPNTNGSQFFLVYKNTPGLQPNYTPFGTIVSGLKIVQNVAKAGSDNAFAAQGGGGHPKEKVVIKSVTIKKT